MMEEKFYFQTSDGLRLCGILLNPQKATDKCIVLCHGVTVDKEEDGIFTELARKLCDAGFPVFRFDFRGHGESEGKSVDMTITGEIKDLEAAIKFLEEKGFKEFGILGASFAGGAVSLFVSSHPKIAKALVLWNAVIDYESLRNPVAVWGKKHWGKSVFDRVEKFGFTEIGSRRFKIGKNLMSEIKTLEPWSKLVEINTPILFVHGSKDTYVPVSDSIKYSSMFNSELKIIDGAEHGFHDRKEDADKANNATIEFFDKYL